MKEVSFAFRIMNSTEKAYSMSHKEVFASVFSFKRFEKTIWSNPLEVKVNHIAVVKSRVKAHADDENK